MTLFGPSSTSGTGAAASTVASAAASTTTSAAASAAALPFLASLAIAACCRAHSLRCRAPLETWMRIAPCLAAFGMVILRIPSTCDAVAPNALASQGSLYTSEIFRFVRLLSPLTVRTPSCMLIERSEAAMPAAVRLRLYWASSETMPSEKSPSALSDVAEIAMRVF